MRHNLFLAFSALCLMTVACGPSKHVMQMEMRYPSKSGVDLSGTADLYVFLCFCRTNFISVSIVFGSLIPGKGEAVYKLL